MTRSGRSAPATPPASQDGVGPAGDPGPPAPPAARLRRRRRTLLLLGATAVTSATALVAVLLTGVPDQPAPDRALTAAEAQRFAAMRVTNHRDVRLGLRITVGTGAARVDLLGWVDWARPLLYLDVGGPGAGADRGLLQATPTLVLTRPDPTAAPTPAPPPLVPPADRWRLRDRAHTPALGPLLDLLFALSTDRTEPGVAGSARWHGTETTAGVPVDVLSAPAPEPRGPNPTAQPAGGTPTTDRPSRAAAGTDRARYRVGHDGRLRRLDVHLPTGAGDGVPVTVDLHRADRPVLRPVAALGGRAGLPRRLTTAERHRLALLPARLRATKGATVTVTAPLGPSANLRAAGWLSWTGPVTYLAVAELGAPERRTLLRTDPTGTSRTERTATGPDDDVEAPARPPLPPPRTGWQRARPAPADLDRLVQTTLRAGDPDPPRATALRLRDERLAGRTVDVIEVRTDPAPVRYWIDREGLLRRLELRTSAGTWAQLDLTPGPVPRLSPPTAAET
ncbi:hypothetical protein [Micromonospora rosaria]|uniref:hypothetical protein n=1 Tax=Micromonospora rosaria TaxID=47874 RepID=UPI000B139683|nr:hypothetical protein [Micromonospora rosaria]